jgi:hypothetical protein|uniref:Metacaspase III c n=3 Tax=Phaeodactylum tricornutum TaxID=2850 RepID=MCA3C_PHATC|nr:RecName: Full=Metacaspase III c; Short=PtMCA-IIIc; Contains: RecName: Full=Small subunit p10; Contains: RecName: Full=Large subunit p20 [Phaeodactylum tricornutum CCAP 1055/1]
MGFLRRQLREQFEKKKPEALQADIRMISGCQDVQTSADVSNVSSFQLPDPAGNAGGACTSTLLNVLYKDHQTPEDTMSFVELLNKMRENLEAKGFSQVPQLTASHPIDVNDDFDLVPPAATGTRRALLIGINYVGHEQGVLRGCHNDVKNMVEYIKAVHGFEDENITILMDDGEHTAPTHANMIAAYKKIVALSKADDALFCHFSGHGAKIRDDDRGEEDDGYDETLVPIDYHENGMIRDDDLYDILIKPLVQGVHLVCLMDCCHSGTVLDLPYVYKADGNFTEMEIDENFDFKKLLGKFGIDDFDKFGGEALGKINGDALGKVGKDALGKLNKFFG